jgi:hypothetical protein
MSATSRFAEAHSGDHRNDAPAVPVTRSSRAIGRVMALPNAIAAKMRVFHVIG